MNHNGKEFDFALVIYASVVLVFKAFRVLKLFVLFSRDIVMLCWTTFNQSEIISKKRCHIVVFSYWTVKIPKRESCS